jgi:ABC-type glycerol-3-phosphate transport system substrate-binding protein
MPQKKHFQRVIVIAIALVLIIVTQTSSINAQTVELSMWTWKVFHVPGLQKVADAFQASTGVKVTVNAYNPDDAYRTKLATAAQSGGLPDIVSYWSTGQWDLASAGKLVELTDKIDDKWKSNFLKGTYDRSSVFPQTGSPSVDACQKDPKCTYKNIKAGQVFSVPMLAGQAFFVYGNKAILKDAGLDPTKPPATTEEWLSMMKTIKEKTGTAGLVTGVKNADVLHFWVFNPLLITSCGVKTYDNIYNGNDTFENPCAMKVLDWFANMGKEDLWMPGILNTDIDPADVAFSQGKAAFDVGGTYTLGFLVAQGMKPEDIMSFAIPPLEGAAIKKLDVSAFSLIEVGVTTESKHQKEALDFIKFLTSPDQMATFALTTNDFPAVKLTADQVKSSPVLAGLVQSMADHSPFDDSKAQLLPDSTKILKIGLQQLITGDTTPAALAKAVQTANLDAWKAQGGSPPPIK